MQTVPRASKKAAVQKESRRDRVVQAAQAGQTDSDMTDEQAAYVASWRVDRTLQLAADIPSICT